MNIIYGGSFNPPTLAHYGIIKKLIEVFDPKHLIIMPVTGRYRFKPNLAKNEDRLNMLALTIKEFGPRVMISEYEMEISEFKGTYQTLEHFNDFFDDLYFVIGADNLKGFKNWIKYDEMIAKYRFIVINREGTDVEHVLNTEYKEYKDKFTVVDFNMHISSTAVRENVDLFKDQMNPYVYQYIKLNHLYEGGK